VTNPEPELEPDPAAAAVEGLGGQIAERMDGDPASTLSAIAVPGVVGVGIDAVDIVRLRSMLARRPGLAARLFTDGELAYAESAPDRVPRLATRFAAKEAVMKCLGVGLGAFGFHDVEVVRIGLDAPTLVIRGAAADLAAVAGIGRWHLALTHTDDLAAAVVVASAVAPNVWV